MANFPKPESLSFAQGENMAFLESLFQQYRQDSASLDSSWQNFFRGFELASGQFTGSSTDLKSQDSAKVEALINAYRRLGHLSADLDPLGDNATPIGSELNLESHGLAGVDIKQQFHPANLSSGQPMPLEQIVSLLNDTYCRKIGADFRETNDMEQIRWLQEKMETTRNAPSLDPELRKHILFKLAQAEGLEKFLQLRFLGHKRFSVEGAEATIPLLDIILSEAANLGIRESCIGMAHRGRLNVLAHILGKSYEQILREFKGGYYNHDNFDIDGDVKYHLGFANSVSTFSGKDIALILSPNPSHLEAVNPVVEGFARARQEFGHDGNPSSVLPILIHGDASFIGQGIVAETLNLGGLKDYATGGTIHVIINNQIGFTTLPKESRSCHYSSDIAKIVRAPVLHVNANSLDAVVWTALLAAAYRQKFQKDIVIDLIGYRRHGHNETDEPGFTQPLMYEKIASMPTALEIYSQQLVKDGVVSLTEIEEIKERVRRSLQAAFDQLGSSKTPAAPSVPAEYKQILAYHEATHEQIFAPANTSVSEKVLREVAHKITDVPAQFNLHPKLTRLIAQRRAMINEGGGIDWTFAELLAFATLANEGKPVRLSGQDCRRGTFSSRHGVLFDSKDNSIYEPLNHIRQGQGPVSIINSPLSEAGVMGFDFGYSIAQPNGLALWEAQFGDFVNGAQIIIDQFLVASEKKWKQTSGLTLLLPHGYEGAGPEHSSGRPERFLQLCGNRNIQVAIPTSAAQYFHILRRQIHREFRKPLVLMTHKSLLRDQRLFSPMSEFVNGSFTEILDDSSVAQPKAAKRLILCTGKIFFDLTAMRQDHPELDSLPIIRLEQLYPFPAHMLKKILSKYPNAKEIYWAQEEPKNMGAWNFARPRILDLLSPDTTLNYVGRRNSGTTAEGSKEAHDTEQKRILSTALGLVTELQSRTATSKKS